MALNWETIFEEEWNKANDAADFSAISNAQAQELSALGAQKNQRERALEKIRREAAQAAYINLKLSQRDAPAQLLAQGLAGGLSESAAIAQQTGYQNALNAVNNEYASGLDALQSEYADDVSDVYAKYAKMLADAKESLRQQAWQRAKFAYDNMLAQQEAEAAAAAAASRSGRGSSSASAQEELPVDNLHIGRVVPSNKVTTTAPGVYPANSTPFTWSKF